MIFPKKLIYEERTIRGFKVDNPESPFSVIYDLLLDIPDFHPSNANSYKKITDVFNNAMYICTDARLQYLPELNLNDYLNVANGTNESIKITGDIAEITLTIAYCFLKQNKSLFPRCERLACMILALIEEYHGSDGETPPDSGFEPIMTFMMKCSPVCQRLDEQDFLPRRLTEDVIDSIDYLEATNDYDIEAIENLITSVGRSGIERLHLLHKIHDKVMCCRIEEDDNWPF